MRELSLEMTSLEYMKIQKCVSYELQEKNNSFVFHVYCKISWKVRTEKWASFSLLFFYFMQKLSTVRYQSFYVHTYVMYYFLWFSSFLSRERERVLDGAGEAIG